MAESRIVCLFVPQFPLAARLRGEPELAHELVVVVEGQMPVIRDERGDDPRVRDYELVGDGARLRECIALHAVSSGVCSRPPPQPK